MTTQIHRASSQSDKAATAGLEVIGAALYQGKAYRLIHESARELIWLDYSTDHLTWAQADAWAAGLNDSGTLVYQLEPGIHVSWEGDWRLPATPHAAYEFGYDGASSAGFNVTTTELATCSTRRWATWATRDSTVPSHCEPQV
ncbi:hypothetical protein [Amycolatopsis saalfeldensis]|uniref:Uncharacterized protein n=1 Tax=Amycolatopsis saalfeldensis TaxID=394193 RepID=A0A1H8U2P5_9PSEU|nr:hypothetical protein [Amycolatopsis saalfeldensis]SEO97326.1 hypothetical protein SAMN04489732_10334 [Amycolatopsis saalfeldensis]